MRSAGVVDCGPIRSGMSARVLESLKEWGIPDVSNVTVFPLELGEVATQHFNTVLSARAIMRYG